MKSVTKQELFSLLWKLYKNQKNDEANVGIDTEDDTNRMRAWFQASDRGETTHEKLEDTFGPDPIRGNPSMCARCGGEGWYHSQKAQMRRRAPNGESRIVEVPGMVVCTCPSGRMKNETIRKHGKAPEKKAPTRGY